MSEAYPNAGPYEDFEIRSNWKTRQRRRSSLRNGHKPHIPNEQKYPEIVEDIMRKLMARND